MTKVDGPVTLSLEGVASTLVSRPSTCHNICGQFRGTLRSTIGPHTFSHDSGTSSPQPGFSNLSSGGNFLSRTLGKNVKKCIAAYCIGKTSEGINHRWELYDFNTLIWREDIQQLPKEREESHKVQHISFQQLSNNIAKLATRYSSTSEFAGNGLSFTSSIIFFLFSSQSLSLAFSINYMYKNSRKLRKSKGYYYNVELSLIMWQGLLYFVLNWNHVLQERNNNLPFLQCYFLV